MQTKKGFDLHRHLLGSILPETVQTLLQKERNVAPASLLSTRQVAFLRSSDAGKALLTKLSLREHSLTPEDLLGFSSLREFLQGYLALSCFVQTESDFSDVVASALTQIEQEGLSYTEVTVSPSLYADRGVPLDVIVGVLEDHLAASPNRVYWLLDPIRNRGPEHAEALLKKCLNCQSKFLCGVSLAGDEKSGPLGSFADFFLMSKQHSLGTTAHVGENPESAEISEALKLPIDRIGHGIAAANDTKVINPLVERGIPLEICLSSNFKTRVVPTPAFHPAKKLYNSGAILTVNTDDTFFFQTTLAAELNVFRELCGEDARDKALTNAQTAAFAA